MSKSATAQKTPADDSVAKEVAAAPATTAKGQTKPKVILTKAQDAMCKKLPTVSARIRYLTDEGYSRADITRAIPNASGDKLRYQHVRNVLEQKKKKAA